MLNLVEGTLLVRTAREAIESYLSGGQLNTPSASSPSLMEPLVVFVTLLDNSAGRVLRGCIGNPFPERPLLRQTAISAVEAATLDPRFEPVRLDEMNQIILEVTVLSPPEQVEVSNPLKLRDEIVVGRHGIIVNGVGQRGLLLPQVAVEEGFNSEEFLSQCCLKAGLLPDAWLARKVQVSRFEGQVFSEERPGGPVLEKKLLNLGYRQ